MAKLTHKVVENLKPKERDYMIGDGHGLWLRVRTSGSKVWIVRKKTGDKVQIVTLGKWPRVTLLEARQKALDPETTEPKVDTTVSELCDAFYDRIIVPGYRRPQQVRSYLDKWIDAHGKKRLVDLTRRELAAFTMAYTKRGRVAANRLLSIVRQALGYAVEVGYVEQNPAEALTRRAAGGEEKARDRVLTDDEIRLLWTLPAPNGTLLRFLLATGQRIGEAQSAQPGHVNEDVWHIPAEHSKNDRAHLVHLSPQAKAIMAEVPAGRDRIFRLRTNTGVQSYLKRWCERNRISPRFTPHDLRRTAATRMHELGIAPHVVEKVLNHALQGVMAIYNRAEYLEERKAALLAWGVEIDRIVAVTRQ